MTSPVDTSVKFFYSEMGSAAPVLQCQPGSLIALLDACLIDGFDSKAATSINVSGGVATIAYSGTHSAKKDSVILVSGVTGSLTALNGEQKVTSAAPGVITFATAAANGAAAGSPAFKMAPVGGWSKVFTGSNKAVYRSLAPESTGMFLRIDDSDAVMARVRGYESMTDVDTGDRPFPTDTEMVNQWGISDGKAGFWPKGFNSSTNPVPWRLFADPRLFMWGAQLYQSQGTVSPSYKGYALRGFGDMNALRLAGDAFCCALSCGTNTSASSYPTHGTFDNGDSDYGMVYMPRDYMGLGSPLRMRTFAYMNVTLTSFRSGQSTGVAGPFPNPLDGSMLYSKRFLKRHAFSQESDYVARADVPGLASIGNSGVARLMPELERVAGSGEFAGRTLMTHFICEPSTDYSTSPQSYGVGLVDVTGPWRPTV